MDEVIRHFKERLDLIKSNPDDYARETGLSGDEVERIIKGMELIVSGKYDPIIIFEVCTVLAERRRKLIEIITMPEPPDEPGEGASRDDWFIWWHHPENLKKYNLEYLAEKFNLSRSHTVRLHGEWMDEYGNTELRGIHRRMR